MDNKVTGGCGLHYKSKYIIGVSILLIVLFASYASASTLGIRDLNMGMRGEDVEELQNKLNEIGYNISVDGVFGSETLSGVQDFQREYGLSSDGVVGSQTLFVLKKLTEVEEYQVQAGDSLYILASRYNTSIDELKRLNDLSGDRINIGQTLMIPNPALGGSSDQEIYININYRVRIGDSLSVLASRYNTRISKIKEVNNLASSNIRAGQMIMIPRKLQPVELKSPTIVQQKSDFIWPTRGRLTSGYGYRTHPVTNRRHLHGGIDIAVPTGTPIKAAASGRVVTSAWLSGFGNTVIINHGNNLETLYAHNSRLAVRAGQEVRQGEVIAYAGSTGQSTGPHLHFEIRVDGDPVNPIDKLPR